MNLHIFIALNCGIIVLAQISDVGNAPTRFPTKPPCTRRKIKKLFLSVSKLALFKFFQHLIQH